MIITLVLVLIAAISYGLGNLNGAIITSTHVFRRDIRNIGSGNAGLSNFYRNFGPRGLASVFVIDAGKGLLSALIGRLLLGLCGEAEIFGTVGALFGIFCCCLGHIYPARYQFRGGKAVLCSAAGIFIVDWRAAMACVIVFVIALVVSRYISLGSILATSTFPIGIFALGYGALPTWLALFSAAIILFKHRENMLRILRHQEPVFEFKKDISHKLDED